MAKAVRHVHSYYKGQKYHFKRSGTAPIFRGGVGVDNISMSSSYGRDVPSCPAYRSK
jgi:hypothetical protein